MEIYKTKKSLILLWSMWLFIIGCSYLYTWLIANNIAMEWRPGRANFLKDMTKIIIPVTLPFVVYETIRFLKRKPVLIILDNGIEIYRFWRGQVFIYWHEIEGMEINNNGMGNILTICLKTKPFKPKEKITLYELYITPQMRRLITCEQYRELPPH